MRGWWQEIAGLVLPVDCAGCGRPRAELCVRCEGLLGGAATARRVRPTPEPPGLPRVYAVGRYADEVRAVLLAHKERGALGLAGPLGTALAGAVAQLCAARRVLLVPVPSARRAVARRGHDATGRMARAAAAVLRRQGTPARAATLLRHRREVADQSGLDAAGRLANLAGAVAVAGGSAALLAAAPVVLVDDLMTTGASLSVSARAVAAAGGRVLGAAVVAGPESRETPLNGDRA